MNTAVIHRASWVIPVADPVIADGAVLCSRDRIKAVGSFSELSLMSPGADITNHGNSVLIPALVNAHIHLELSHLPLPSHHEKINGFTGWIAAMLSMREEFSARNDIIEAAARKIVQGQHKEGVIALGDIGNSMLGSRLQKNLPGILLHFQEFLGRSEQSKRLVRERIAKAAADTLLTAHAPYSTHPDIIKSLKKRAGRYDHPFPIHVAEPSSENEMLCCGTGELADFLKSRSFIDESYQPPAGQASQGSVEYLHNLGVLDHRTICVHSVHVSPAEITLLADSGAKVCLCPGSNRYLGVGKAPVGDFLEQGLLPALGTDSMASNPELSIWREMQLLSEDHPYLEPADIFAMATLGGARALGIEDRFGALAPGKSPFFLVVSLPEKVHDTRQLYQHLVTTTKIRPEWVSEQ